MIRKIVYGVGGLGAITVPHQEIAERGEVGGDVAARRLEAGRNRDAVAVVLDIEEQREGEGGGRPVGVGRLNDEDDGLADLVERSCVFAQRFATGLRDAGYSVLNEVVLNQVVVSFGSDEETRRVIAGVQADGTCWCSGTSWNGRAATVSSI